MRWVVLIGLFGCGRIGFDRTTSDAALADVAIDAPPCTFSAWATPEMRPELDPGSGGFGGQLTGDGLAYYFQSANQLYVSHRASRSAAWSAPALITDLTGNGDIIEASPSDDELTLYFNGNFNNQTSCNWVASRATTAEPFGNFQRLDATCPGMVISAGPNISPDGLTLYYNTIDANALGTILESHRASLADPFIAGTPIPGLPADHLEGYPFMMPDRLTIYYEGVLDPQHELQEAHRTDSSAAFGTPFSIPNVEDGSTNEDISLTHDGLVMYFASGRGTGTFHIFSTSRTCD